MKNFKLFVELSDEEAQKARELGKARGNVLDHLFKGKERVFFPLPPDPELYKLKKILEKIPHPRSPEIPKYKVGMSDLRAGQVRLLSKAKHPEKGEYISDKNVTTITRALVNEKDNPTIRDGNFEMVWNDIQPYWVVVSRHPIDVKRMSDFQNLQSCHSYGGAYYNCTDEEVGGGGGVAYLIHASDFSKIKQDDDEIFADKGFKSSTSSHMQMPHRGLEGIIPVARTRIRRAENPQTKAEIGVVEDAVYGIEEGGHLANRFLKALRQWVSTKQPDNPTNSGNYEMLGGSYTDSSVKGLHTKLYERNPGYMARFLEKIQKMDNEEEISSALEQFVGVKPAMVMRLGGRKLWVSNAEPKTPYDLFRNTWLARYLSVDNTRFVDPIHATNLIENEVEAMNQFEKYLINMLNRGGTVKLVKAGEKGWVAVMPVASWIESNSAGARRVNRIYNNPTGDQNPTKLAANITREDMKRKLTALMSGTSAGPRTGPLVRGETVWHPFNGKASVTQAADGPGHSVQVRWAKDGSYNFVIPNMLYRTEAEAKAKAQEEEAQRQKWRLARQQQQDSGPTD